MQPYFSRRFALTINNKLLCLHSDVNRIIIPSKFRSKILMLLHDGHETTSTSACFVAMYRRRHSTTNYSCTICKLGNPAPVKEFQSWPKATSAWERIHIDFAGPIFDSMWLICVDAYSQFPFIT